MCHQNFTHTSLFHYSSPPISARRHLTVDKLKKGNEGNKSGKNGSSETLVDPHIGSSRIRLMPSLFKAALESQHSMQSVPTVRKAGTHDSLRGAY